MDTMLFRNSRRKLSQGLLFWREVGDGIPVVFLHGACSDSSEWVSTMELMSRDFHCFAPDLLGFGESEYPDIHHAIDLHVDCLVEFLQALKLNKQLVGEKHPATATSLNNLAYLYFNQGKYKQAEPLFIQALQLKKQLLGFNHPDTATSLNNLALLYYGQGKYEQAEFLFIQALEISERVLGKNHPITLTFRGNLEYLRGKQ